jgi:TonB family protein
MILTLSVAWAQEAPAPAPDELPPIVKAPEVVHFVEAPFPDAARVAGLEGTVGLSVTIDETGAVTNVEVTRPIGYGFDEAAVAAVRQFQFSPAEDANGPVAVVIDFNYGFVLDATTREDAVPEAPTPDAPVAEAPVNLDGVVLEMGTRRPLAGIPIRVEPLGLDATTDADGRYTFRGVPAGAVTLLVNFPGYDRVETPVAVSGTELTTVKVWLRNQAYDDGVVLGLYRKETTEVTRREISMDEIRRVPGTFGDPIRVIQSLPGAARAPFGTGLLIIRGSNPEDSGVYIDGIRIPYIYHLGGFESVINPDLVAGVDYLPGGYGVAYGRSTGGVVDVTTTEEFPERKRVTWSTDVLDSGGMVVGRFGKNGQHGVGFAARRSYIDALLPLFVGDTGFVVKPVWYDFQAKYAYLGGRDTFSVLVFGFRDDLIASSPAGQSQGTDPSTQGDLGTAYSTYRAVVKWEHPISDTLTFRFIPSFGNDWASLNIGNDWHLEQSQWLAEVRAELPWKPSEHLTVTPGIDFLGGVSPFTIELPFDPGQFGETDPLAEREPYTVKDTQWGWGPDPYLAVTWCPLQDPERLVLTPGIRGTFVTLPGEITTFGLDPRIGAKFALTPKTRLKGSIGVYHQPPQPFESYTPDDRPVDLEQERALSGTVGWEQDVGSAVHGEVEIFYKSLDRLIVQNPDFASMDDPFFSNSGVGRAYGLEVIVRHDPVGKLFGWVSYTLSRSERQDAPDEAWYRYDYDQTHILSAVAGYKLPYDFEISAKGQYVTGNPTTPYAFGVYDVDQDEYQGFRSGARNSERLPPYWAVSARFDKLFTFKAWQLDLYVDLLNVLHGENPEFEVYNYDYTEKRYITGIPFIPGPGFEAKFEF